IAQARGAQAGLLLSAGAEEDLYGDDPAGVIAQGFIRPEMITGIGGAIDENGTEAAPVNPEEVLAAVRGLVHRGARIIGVCLRNAWRNDAHEVRVREIIHERYPVHYLRSVPLQLSTEVSPVSNDHARANSLIVNEMLHREMTRSLYDLEDRLRDAGYRWPLLVTHASGGCARVAKTVAAETLQSGPAAAVLGAWRIAQLTGAEHVVAADMGGTSLDVAFASAEQPPWDPRPTVEGVPLAIPMLGVESIGAGGGSIARVDGDGTLSVGPDSAGSYPGPACYGQGGVEGTVTDADLILGYIDPGHLLAGRMPLDLSAAWDAVTERVAAPSGTTLDAAAAMVRETIDGEMAAAIVRGIEERGLEPAGVTLLAFGGAGPLHAASIAEHVGIRRVLAFPFGSVFSAYGSSTTDVMHLYRDTHGLPAASPGLADAIESGTERMQSVAVKDMRGEGFRFDELDFQTVLELWTGGRPALVPTANGDGLAGAVQRVTNGLDEPGPVALEATWMVVSAGVPHWSPERVNGFAAHELAASGSREVTWSAEQGPVATPTHELTDLTPGAVVEGPAVVDAADTGYVVPGGWRLAVDGYGFLEMTDTRP
ncbi:MAG: hydantoinase/oxoprolinase family protein, partial [Chloroflexi bacterium]|nr:hydantoinase/oxoprolinase family protein [Chloroflexota bacterium]